MGMLASIIVGDTLYGYACLYHCGRYSLWVCLPLSLWEILFMGMLASFIVGDTNPFRWYARLSQ
jgi:hypothetical protein